MKTLTFQFKTKEQYDEFVGWFLDGGGEQEFYDAAVEMRHAIPSFVVSWDLLSSTIKIEENTEE